MATSGIYKIRNLVNNKVYIGQSKNLKERKKQHFSALRGNKHWNKILQYSWNKHSEENFRFEIIKYAPEHELDDLEKHCALMYNAHDRDFGYNIAECGGSGSIFLGKSEDEMIQIRKKCLKQD